MTVAHVLRDHGFRVAGRRMVLVAVGVAAGIALATPQARSQGPAGPGGLVAYVSDAGQPLSITDIHLFDLRSQQPVALPGVNTPATETHPWLTGDGRLLAYSRRVDAAARVQQLIHVRDLRSGTELDAPGLNTPELNLRPSMSADGRLLASFSLPQSFSGSDPNSEVRLYDLKERMVIELPGANSKSSDGFPALSPDGRYLGFESMRNKSTMRSDVLIYDVVEKKLLELPNLNKANEDQQVSLSQRAELIAFASNRGYGVGSFDIYLHNRLTGKDEPLPGLNSSLDDRQPSISPDGRWIVFASNRRGGAGSLDLYLYDRQTARTTALESCNTRSTEAFPVLSNN